MQEQRMAKNHHSENDAEIVLESLRSPGQNRQSDYWESSGNRNAEWCFGESSSAAARSPSLSDERKLELGWKTRNYQEQRQHIDLSSGISRRSNEHLFLQTPSLEAFTQDLNVSAGYEGVEEIINVDDTREPSDVLRPDCRSSDSLNLIPDGSSGFRRMSHKRKASEAGVGHSPDIGASDRSKRSERHQRRQQIPPVPGSGISFPMPTGNQSPVFNNGSETANSRIRTGRSVSANPQVLTASERAEILTRSLHLNMNRFRQQDHVSGNQFDIRNVDLSSASRMGNGSHHTQPVLQPPPWRRNQQSRLGAASSRRTSSSSSSSRGRSGAVSVTRSSSDPVFLHGDGIRSSSEQPISWSSAAGGNLHLGGNVGSSSTAVPSTVSHQRLFVADLRRLFLSAVIPSSGATTSRSNHPLRAPGSSSSSSSTSTSQGIAATAATPSLSVRPHSHRSVNSRPVQLERRLEGAPIVPLFVRASAPASEGRRSMMSEQICRVLDLVQRGGGVRFEDMMLLDHSALLGMAGLEDQHRDMRMDVDNMSYEELLALEEQIGSVCTGLSEETIAKHLKKRIYVEKIETEGAEEEPCCICRGEYSVGEDVGELDCGHEFHGDCIKQWLLQKNVCPICKTTGLKT